MTKKVSVRNWSIAKFTESVNKAAKKNGLTVNAKRLKKAYDDAWSVTYTVSQIAK